MPPGPDSLRRTPLYDWHVARGARLVDFAGWEMPVQYTTITDEHQAVRQAAGLFDISHMGRLVFDGPDALALIQRLYTNNAAIMKGGQVRYGLVCNEQGGIRDDVLVYRLPASWLMVVNASNREKILAWIEQHRPGLDARVTDQTFARAMVAVQGPRATLLTRAPALAQQAGAIEALRYYQAVEVAAPGGSWLVSRTGYTGEDGFELIVPAEQTAACVEQLAETFRANGVELKPCGLGARDTLRLEAAMPLYGHELTEETDPFEAGLGWAVKMDKGDFIGRAALEQRRQDPNRPRRVGLELDGRRIAREGAAVLREGRPVGRVTSGTFAPTLGKAIAMAYVAPPLPAPGTALEVDVRGKPAPARVVPLPFYQRQK